MREGVYRLLGPRVTFGVVARITTVDDPHRPPLAAVERQAACWSAAQANETISWPTALARWDEIGDCRLGFLQSLCDLQVRGGDRGARAARFDDLRDGPRLRADLFWEAAGWP